MPNATDGIFTRIPELEDYCAEQRKKNIPFGQIAKMASAVYLVPITEDQVKNRLKRVGKATPATDAFVQRQREIEQIIEVLPADKREQLKATLNGMLPLLRNAQQAEAAEEDRYSIPEKHRAPKRYPAIRADGKPYVVFVVNDLHVPDHNEAQVASLTKAVEEAKPDLLILNGDIFNGSALCAYAKKCRAEKRSFDIGQEIEMAKPFLQRWINAASAAVYVGGNHDVDRMERLLANEGAGLAYDVNKVWYLMVERYGYENLRFFDPELRGPGRLLWVGNGPDEVGFQHGHVYPRHTAWKNLTEQWPGRNSAQGHTHRPQLFWHRGKLGLVGGHMLDVRKMYYMPNEDWTPGFSVYEFYDQGTRFDARFVRMYDDGAFLYNGTIYTAA